MLIVAVVIVILIALAVAVYFGHRIERRRRTPSELRGDWWARFEEEFRVYARRLESPRRRRPGGSGRGSLGQ